MVVATAEASMSKAGEAGSLGGRVQPYHIILLKEKKFPLLLLYL